MGMYLVTFFGCMRVLIFPDGRVKSLGNINIKMLIPALLMFVFGTMDVAFGLQHNIEAFIQFEGDPIDEFNNTADWINVMKMVNYVAQTFIGDGILLYRCWIVYSKKWLVILFPALMWVAGTVCGIMTAYIEATLTNDGALLNASNLVPFITSMLTLTLAMNLITTSLIVHRIWSIQRAVKFRATVASEKGPLSKVMRILIESGLMYTMSIVILFGLYMASNNGQFGVSNSVVQIIGITFNLIITRVDRGEATQPTSQYRSATGNNNLPLHAIHIQTSVSRYQDPSNASVSDSPEAKAPSEWK
ncbi:hypothetical protein D9615_008606 [Tricholomella constricta]|uniref:Uncharacterized protein n=1 Tax=Tricholomella constricta TaxID=117010 RepID=A0A8H5H467_9AGAR|nr:hypothetical protein D9615_008606 [Tricholomella constricta]